MRKSRKKYAVYPIIVNQLYHSKKLKTDFNNTVLQKTVPISLLWKKVHMIIQRIQIERGYTKKSIALF